MTTATTAPRTQPPSTTTPTAPLFPQPIPIIGITGEYASGKSLFALTVAPGPSTLCYDLEKSSESYLSLGFERIDVPSKMLARHRGGYKPIQTFEWWRDHVRSIEPGKYRVIVLDPASEIESGAADWVRTNPGYFGRSAAQYIKMSGLMWGDMKELWKALLADLASRCETFVFCVHMGDVWNGDNKPSGKRKPRGKSTLMELASLYLVMERKADVKGVVAAVPSATVLKSRLAHTRFDPRTGQLMIVPALPPRLPIATPTAIREYQLSPPNYDALKADEKAPEIQLTDDDRAATRLATAEAERDTEQFRLERIEREQRQREMAMRRYQGEEKPAMGTGTASPTPMTATSIPPTNGQPMPTPAPPHPIDPNKARLDQLDRLATLRDELFDMTHPMTTADMETNETARRERQEAWKSVLAKRNVATARDLTPAQADELMGRLSAKVASVQLEQGLAASAAPGSDYEKGGTSDSRPGYRRVD